MSQNLKKIELNNEGIRALLKSEEIAAACVEVANQVQQRAGEGYAVAAPHYSDQRVIVNVYPATKEAAHDNYENHTLNVAAGI